MKQEDGKRSTEDGRASQPFDQLASVHFRLTLCSFCFQVLGGEVSLSLQIAGFVCRHSIRQTGLGTQQVQEETEDGHGRSGVSIA